MNDLSKVVDKLLAQGLLALRGTCVMPRLWNSDYSNLAAQQGASIDVPIPSAIKAQAVTPGATSQDTGDISPVSATIKLDRWMEAPFYLTDKDLMEANRGVIPMQASEAVKAIANDVNATLLGLGRKFYGMVGTPGTTPFSTVVDATNARKVLNRQLAPVNDRRIVLDPDAEAAALGLSGFADVSKSGDARPIIDGTIGRKYGFDWAMDQQVPSFEASVMTEGALTVNGANEAGAQVVSLAKATNAAGLKEGDILTIAGDAQTYVVTEAVSLAVGNTAVKIYPGLARATTGSEAVTVSGSHVMNLAFHRDAIAFATRPLMDSANGLGNLIQSAVDPVSGLSLRLEVSREHKRTRFSYDILYGADVVRREGRQAVSPAHGLRVQHAEPASDHRGHRAGHVRHRGQGARPARGGPGRRDLCRPHDHGADGFLHRGTGRRRQDHFRRHRNPAHHRKRHFAQIRRRLQGNHQALHRTMQSYRAGFGLLRGQLSARKIHQRGIVLPRLHPHRRRSGEFHEVYHPQNQVHGRAARRGRRRPHHPIHALSGPSGFRRRRRTQNRKDRTRMTKDAKNEQAKAPLPMESFFTRENANEGIELPLLLPDGTKTEHWLRIRGVDADGFRKAEARSKRKMLEIAAEKDLDKRDAEVEDTRLAMLAALVIGWSFDNPCTEAEIKRLFREAPQIAEQVDRTAYDRARFFGNSSKGSSPTPGESSS